MTKTITILNASPRKHGIISKTLGAMRDALEEQGADVNFIEVCSLNVRPCIGCMKCRSNHACCLPTDDSVEVVELLRKSDSIIVGTPTYWGNMNGQLKVLFDRMVYGMMDEHPNGMPKALHKGKKAIIVSCCTTIWPFNILFHQSSGAIGAVKEVLKWSGFKIVGRIQRGGTRKDGTISEAFLDKCCKTALKLLK